MIKTLGTRVTDIEPAQGFSAETGASSTILASSYFGFSLSTTQVVSGGIMGSGLGKAGGVVHWKVVRNMVVAWILTLPGRRADGRARARGRRGLPERHRGRGRRSASSRWSIALRALLARPPHRPRQRRSNVIEPPPPARAVAVGAHA